MSNSEPLGPADLAQFIQEQHITAEIVLLDEHTPTVEAAAQVMGVRPDQIGKSILFLADGRPLLIIANSLTRIDYRKLAQHLGIGRRRLRLANAEQVLDITGYPVGTMPPFGHKQPLPTLLDARVPGERELYAGGGGINALLRITTAELQRVVAPQIVALAEDGPGGRP